MAQSLSKVLVHLIFSSKHREPLILRAIRSQLHAYLVGIMDCLKSPSLLTGGVADHVHILCMLSRTLSQAELVEALKTGSSKWMKRNGGGRGFSWQAGYGAFSVSESQIDAVKHYIHTQEEHHKRMTFQEEFRKFLKQYNIPFDERYVWD